MRTPLAATLAQIQRLCREAPEGPLQVRAAQIEASLRELSRLSEKLMQLAKAEGGGLLSQSPQDLVSLSAYVVEEPCRQAGERLQLELPASEQVLSVIDPDAFAILLRNLIENALKHGAADQPVAVSLEQHGAAARGQRRAPRGATGGAGAADRALRARRQPGRGFRPGPGHCRDHHPWRGREHEFGITGNGPDRWFRGGRAVCLCTG